MAATLEELDRFREYTASKLGNGGADATLEELLSSWRQEQEYREAIDDVRQSVAKIEAGQGKPLAAAFDEIRRNLGLAP